MTVDGATPEDTAYAKVTGGAESFDEDSVQEHARRNLCGLEALDGRIKTKDDVDRVGRCH